MNIFIQMNTMSNNVRPWVQKYRPKTLDEIVLPPYLKERFKEPIVDNHLFFSGSSGCGKTSLAHILTENHITLMLNGSVENTIEVIRERVIKFCSTNPLSLNKHKTKVIWFDEADKLTPLVQEALKGITEKYEDTVKFLFTTNHPQRITKELKSRFEEFDFNALWNNSKDIMLGEVYKKLVGILKQEKLTITKDAIVYLVDKRFPDIRKMQGDLNSISKIVESGGQITLDLLKTNHTEGNKEFFEFLTTTYKQEDIFQFITGNFTNKEIDAIKSLGEPFLNYLMSVGKGDKVLQISTIVHKYNYEATTGDVDKLLPLLACCYSITQTLK